MALKSEEVTVKNAAGDEKTFIIHEIPAWEAREIIAQYPVSALPKLGDYKVNEAMARKMLAHVEVVTGTGENLKLKTVELINNHCDFVTLARLEGLMFTLNFSFFLQGPISSFSAIISQKAQAFLSSMSMGFSGQSSQKDAPASPISEPSTR